ncbi:photosystem II oxygen-evolving enhancer protein 2 [Fistulifera solaris]|jgi:hypothetical protein|uniref:Photosystem II oxygen-evolving enhancer protein 2 n=1 Tax=Fistulifera solaris TaxID=1519565 RepID=A0A1Z5KDR5_FISSO|nr:photosystem II oxygen-evolving enhancer protein 2 [Fistulifera solaris]|eukprot:GAX24450.1 photosystem II oxygen-evolving enhancer protein 2 [Fistulifera solaris]
MLRFTTLNLLLAFTAAWSTTTRREALHHMTAAVIATSAAPAFALPTEETPRVVTRMGGLLEPYQDGPRGFRLLAPSGWNKFDGEVGAYDVKWQDLVDPLEQIKLSSTPVKSSIESVAALGTLEELGPKLAAKRNQATLVQASERLTDGILFYTFEFALPDQTHQMLLLTIHKSKLWSLDANARNEARWKKRSELYANVVGSFMPKLT